MPKQNKLQKFSVTMSLVSLLLGLASGIWLYFRSSEIGIADPVSASLIACVIFFGFVAVVLFVMGTADLPSMKFDSEEQ